MPLTASPAANMTPDKAAPTAFAESTSVHPNMGLTMVTIAMLPAMNSLAKGDTIDNVCFRRNSVRKLHDRKGEIRKRVAMDVPMNVNTEARLRGLNLARPQIPWPVVQPF
mmetsp:Transcript_9172/g.25381  ORF Transcript_9172/g.25381 Transcript_9172/m.25381 type:complete len:110 (+) Transcript_9172:2478-2807(+)